MVNGWHLASRATLGVCDVAHGQDLQTLNPGLFGNRTEAEAGDWLFAAEFSPDGRLAAVATREGVYLYDVPGGRNLARLKTGHSESVLFDRDGRFLITFGLRGMFRWPIRHEPEGGKAVQIGPPELLRAVNPDLAMCKAIWLPDHRTLAMIDNANARVLLLDTALPRSARSRARTLSSGSNHRMTIDLRQP